MTQWITAIWLCGCQRATCELSGIKGTASMLHAARWGAAYVVTRTADDVTGKEMRLTGGACTTEMIQLGINKKTLQEQMQLWVNSIML